MDTVIQETWVARETSGQIYIDNKQDIRTTTIVAFITPTGISGQVTRDRARLMASAPRLLRGLKRVADHIRKEMEHYPREDDRRLLLSLESLIAESQDGMQTQHTP